MVEKQSISVDDVRHFLKYWKDNHSPSYGAMLNSLRRFFRDFLNYPDIVRTFKYPPPPLPDKVVLSKEQLQQFYNTLSTLKEKAYFLMLATTGLRRSEVLKLEKTDISFDTRMVRPKPHEGRTKHSWITFFNDETKSVLKEYLETIKSESNRLFPNDRRRMDRSAWKRG